MLENPKLDQILLFHPMKFVCRSFTQFSKDLDVNVYSLESVEEFSYLLNELSPAIVFIHQSLLSEDKDFFQGELEKAAFHPNRIVIIGKESVLESLEWEVEHSFLYEPYALEDLENIFKGFLAESHKTD